MKEIHLEDIKGNDGNVYRIRIFDDSNKLLSSIHLVTVLHGKEDEGMVLTKEYPKGAVMLEILEQLKVLAMSVNFRS